jgi:hypothetical protein
MAYDIKPFKDEVLCDFFPLEVYDVLLGQPYMSQCHVFYESQPDSVIVTLGGESLQGTRGSSDYYLSKNVSKQIDKIVEEKKYIFVSPKYFCFTYRGSSTLHIQGNI